MRIWSVHPRYLDQKGLVACWRETLLAQKVLQGLTKGYTNHPQLERFRAHQDPLAAIGVYLQGIHAEAVSRGYNFDGSKIVHPGPAEIIDVTDGQMVFERGHLLTKLTVRDPERADDLPEGALDPHPLFRVVVGGVASWERP
ncbi:DNA lyase [Corynebacterium testudinoris]|uniref:pyrimidine dimer DNA glycosylase/endonuclease V n=1 Tax=Corynebacterium testudinoris TaxID=136857 RepID=UPI00064115AC|nr:pyrimidine dimer DNA glycosylase/endonuclease V [Corynebacterium testudinoris]MBX8996422.1 DNA lyase [Corynebacterium testudinoris]